MDNLSLSGLRALRLVLDLSIKDAGAALSEMQAYLTYDEDQKALAYIRDHFQKYGTLPSPDTVLDHTNVLLPEASEPLAYYRQSLQDRYITDALRAASDTASTLLAEGDPKEALTQMLGQLIPVTQGHAGLQVSDFRSTDVVQSYAYAVTHGVEIDRLGYPTMDEQGGIEDGDMIGLIGRPGSGKTWLMLSTALRYWARYQKPVLFVTQEMSRAQIERRAMSLMASVPPGPLYHQKENVYEVDGYTQAQYMQLLEEARQDMQHNAAPFLIYDSKMAGTVADIENIAAMHGVRRVWIDGAYMLRHPDKRMTRYQRVPENLDLMKQWQQRTGVMTMTSWQFKRGAGKDSEEVPDLDDIGYSHAIPEYMGIVVGLLENPKSLAQMNKKHVTVMKGRNGEVGGFWVEWDFKHMRFEEIVTQENETDIIYI